MNSDFFKEEVREGFCISAEMKKVWAVEMKVLSFVISVCKKYDIPYFADYGTLLGTVRHKGFIPWDDDIDICLKRSDYMHLIEAFKKENNTDYVYNGFYFSDTSGQPFMSVSDYTGVPIPASVQEKFFGCPYVAGIDIYPLDYVPRDSELAGLQLNMYVALYDIAIRFYEISRQELEENLNQIEQIYNVKFVRDNTLRGQIWRLADSIAAMFTEEESDKLTFLARNAQGDVGFGYNKEWYDSSVDMKFEDMDIAVPCGHDDILTMLYGDYKVTVCNTSSHNYPFYAKQKEFLLENGYEV